MTDVSKAQSQSPPSDSIWGPAFKEAGVAFMAAALLLGIFYVLAFRWIHPEFVPYMDREADKVVAVGKDLIPVSVGGYRVKGTNAIIEDFNGDEAIIALPRSFQAEDYPFLKVNLQGFTRYSKFKILWRRADDPSQTHALEFNRSGDGVTQIAMVYGNENYRGQIADIALLFYDGPALGFENNNDVDISIHSVELRPFSAWGVAEQIFEDWTNPPLWQGYSINIVRGVHKHGILSPNVIATLLVVTGMIALGGARVTPQKCGFANSKTPMIASILCLCVYGWGCADALRWQWRIEQLFDTRERYAGKVLEERVHSNPIRCARFTTDCKADMLPDF